MAGHKQQGHQASWDCPEAPSYQVALTAAIVL